MSMPPTSLKRQLLQRLAITAAAVSLLLLLAFLAAYRSQLESERRHTSLGYNQMLQATLENAMLKRDVPGLRDIVGQLGSIPGIRSVFILNPKGEVRFASRPELLGRQLPGLLPATSAPPKAEFALDEAGADVLRSINPVRNKPPCAACHGEAATHPVNGILVVDYDATEIRRQAWLSAGAFSAAGLGVLLLIFGLLWRGINRHVLAPVAELGAAAAALESGQSAHRANIAGNNELAELGKGFNRMADRLGEQMALVRAHEAYLQEVLDSLPDGVRVIRTDDKRIVLVNAAYCAQLGISRRLALGDLCHANTHRRKEPCIPTLVDCPLCSLHAVGDRFKATHRHLRANGQSFPVEIHAVLVELEQGGHPARYIVESIRDLSAAARISHEQRLSELGLLAAGVAHEIHNPLGSVRLGVQGMLREIRDGTGTPEDAVGYLHLIDTEIDKCINVTRRLLLLSRTPGETRQVVDVGAALDDTLKLLEFDARSQHIASRYQLPAEPVRILGDESELRMIFLNLLQNAHHAMIGGGTLDARVAAEDGMAVIDIADSGAGIAPDVLPHIFDPFYSHRADGAAGTGLGLTIVKNIVERHGGTIELESALGTGTRFRVRVPLAGNDTPS